MPRGTILSTAPLILSSLSYHLDSSRSLIGVPFPLSRRRIRGRRHKKSVIHHQKSHHSLLIQTGCLNHFLLQKNKALSTSTSLLTITKPTFFNKNNVTMELCGAVLSILAVAKVTGYQDFRLAYILCTPVPVGPLPSMDRSRCSSLRQTCLIEPFSRYSAWWSFPRIQVFTDFYFQAGPWRTTCPGILFCMQR